MTNIALCPHCASPATLKVDPGSYGYMPATYWVQCTACGARTGIERGGDREKDDAKAKASVIAVWNRRVGSPSDKGKRLHAVAVEALK